jgi:hypothetical protein
MGLFLSVLIALLALHSLWLGRLLGKGKHERARKRIEIIVIILMLVAVGWNYYRQNEEIKEQNQLWLSQNDSLRVQIDELSQKLEPFLQMARTSYPALRDEEALTKLATEISKTLGGMQPKIIYLSDKTKSWKDTNTNLLHTIYYFRSQYPVAVRDISITMKFDRTLLRAEGKITGAFVVEQESRMMINADSGGFTFVTGLLGAGNDIMIEVISNESLKIRSMQLSPDQ